MNGFDLCDDGVLAYIFAKSTRYKPIATIHMFIFHRNDPFVIVQIAKICKRFSRIVSNDDDLWAGAAEKARVKYEKWNTKVPFHSNILCLFLSFKLIMYLMLSHIR